jgi:hypothetical protein
MAIQTLSTRLHQDRVDLSLVADCLRFPWITLVFLAGSTITALLAARLWLQMSDPSSTETGAGGVFLSVTEFLVSPYRDHESATVNSAGAIFEFSTLLAVQAYLIATLTIVLAIAAARLAIFVASRETEAKPLRRRAVFALQPVAAGRGTPSAALVHHSEVPTKTNEDPRL